MGYEEAFLVPRQDTHEGFSLAWQDWIQPREAYQSPPQTNLQTRENFEAVHPDKNINKTIEMNRSGFVGRTTIKPIYNIKEHGIVLTSTAPTTVDGA